METIETDYLVVGAGASGMAFTDTFLLHGDGDVVIVDRRNDPGGHWNDAYPFVRLHQPAANYGVESTPLGSDRIEETGPNAGYYELASGKEVCAYFRKVLDERFLPSGRVRFRGMTDHSIEDGRHILTSYLDGTRTEVRVRKRTVDARFSESTIPSRHTPSFEIDDGATVLPPNDLIERTGPASGYTVLGAGKTAMDTCAWLLRHGVDPDAIRWVRGRDPWTMDRAGVQPHEKAVSFLDLQADMLEAAAKATDGRSMAADLEERGVLMRFDRSVEPDVFRAASLTVAEVEELRAVEQVVRLGRVRRIGTSEIVLDGGTIPTDRDQVHVDCTAAATPPLSLEPRFTEDTITTGMLTFGVIPWSGATLGYVEATRDDTAEKNRLCPPVAWTGEVDDLPILLGTVMAGTNARLAEADINTWQEALRLNPAAGLAARASEPEVQAAMGRLIASLGPALEGLARMDALPG